MVCARERRRLRPAIRLTAACAAAFLPWWAGAAVPTNLLENPGFEQGTPEKGPANWTVQDFRTGGSARWVHEGAHEGTSCVALQSRSASERSCWLQKVVLPEGTPAVAAGGWYRTQDTVPGHRTGPTFRVHFHRDTAKWDEIGLRQTFLPPAENWTQTEESYFPVPAGTKAVVMQVFHWLTPGETQWDNVWLRPVTEKELPTVMTTLAEELGIDRDPVPGRNRPYSPADGATVDTNPPPFLWLPGPQGAAYRLAVSREPDFPAAGTRELSGLRWCAQMLTERLTPGTWHWRYGVDIDSLGTVWSRTRRFTVPETADPWPYPDAGAFTVSAARPRLFVTADRLPGIRRRAREGDLKDTARRLKDAVARYAGEDLVAEPDWLPKGRDRGPAYTLTFRATRPPMDRMEQAALAYLLTGDPACGDEARRRVLHFFSWDPHGPTNVFHNDEPAMWVMMRGVRAYDWTWNLFSESERNTVETAIRERARDFYKKLSSRPFENNPYESHQGRIIGFLGEAALAFAPEWDEARTWLDYITTIYWGVYPAWGREDGGWNEGPGYWSAYMSFGLHFVVALREATGIDLSGRPFFRNTPYYRLYLTPPYSRMAPFGDGTQFAPSRCGPLMYWFSSLLRDPCIRWYPHALGQGSGDSILGVVLKDDSLAPVPPVHLPQARHFEGVGLVSLHTDLGDADNDVSFAIRSSPYGAVSHGHNDQNCFVVEAFGEPLAIATGHYNRYGSPHHDGWTRQTKAKCGITLDGGAGQDRGWHARGDITHFLHGDPCDLVRADATPAYGGRLDRAVRETVHIRPGIFVIHDDLEAPEAHVFDYWLHALDRMHVDEQNGRVLTERPKARLITHILHPNAPVYRQTDEFDPPPTWPPGREFANNWHLRISTATPARKAQFLTVLVPERAGASDTCRVESTADGAGCRITFPDGAVTEVLFKGTTSSRPVDMEGLRTDAATAVIRRDSAGRVSGWALRDGTFLAVQGVTLFSSSRAVSVIGPAVRP